MGHRAFGLITTVGGAAMLVAVPDLAQGQSNAELMDIIRQQQRQIEELSRRIDELQGQAQETAAKADAAAETTAPAAEAVDWEVSGGPSPTFRSKDGRFEAHVRGRLFVDGGYLDDRDGFYRNDNATELRAARLGIEGKADNFDYLLEVDFADGEADLEDAFIEYDGAFTDPAYVRAGQFKTPNSLEELTSSRFITFMERAAFTDAFELDRRIGLGSGLGGDNWGVDAGLFGQNASDVANNEGFAIAGRGHYAFLDTLRPDSVIHLGASARFRDLENDVDDDSARYRQRPFFHFTDTRSVDTGTSPDADNDVLLGGEAALVLGPFSLQGEVAHTWLQRQGGAADADGLWGGYLSASYFLTGESRDYEADGGVFGRVRVSDPVFEGGSGAWEFGARLDYIALNDGSADIKGGDQYSIIGGVNWYLDDNVRFMIDYALSRVFNARNSPGAAADGSSDVVNGVGARVQLDF